MAEKTRQAYPLAPANGYMRSDGEALSKNELKRKKSFRCFAYIVKIPKVRLSKSTLTGFTSSTASPSFATTFNTQIRVRNTNWGPYKFDAGTMTFLYQDTTFGTVNISKGKAEMRGTEKINVSVDLNAASLPSSSTLSSELSGGVLTLNSEAKLTGKVELMMIMKKKKSATMNCTIRIDVNEKSVKSLLCK